jgi:hypothetical protein
MLPSLGEKCSNILINMLAPFWFDLPAFAHMDNVVQSEQKMIQTEKTASGQIQERLRTAFGLNAIYPATARLHASRAGYLKKMPYTIIMPPADAGTDEEGRYTSHINAEIKQRSGWTSQSESLDTVMINLAIQQPIFVIVPHGTDKEVVRRLRKRFWPFIFIVLTGQDKPDEWNLAEFVMLQPPLEVGVEDQICSMEAHAKLRATTIINGL